MIDLFNIPAEEPPTEFVFVADRRYQLKDAKITRDGKTEDRVVVSWVACNALGQIEPGAMCGVLGGYHADTHAALAAIDAAEDRRAQR